MELMVRFGLAMGACMETGWWAWAVEKGIKVRR
jgi:hypothetical protein